MRIDFGQVLKNFKGIPIKIENEDCTLTYVAVTALLGTYPDERELAGAEKARRYQLAKAIHDGVADPTIEDRALIKTLIGKAFIPLIVGPAFEALEVETEPTPPVPANECAVPE